jgi:hypothetical protein
LPSSTTEATEGGGVVAIHGVLTGPIADGRNTLGAQLVLENNSLRQSYLTGAGNYQTMYAFMDQVGGPIAFQTSTIGRTGWLASALEGAIALSAGSVELPSGYESDLTPSQDRGHQRRSCLSPAGPSADRRVAPTRMAGRRAVTRCSPMWTGATLDEMVTVHFSVDGDRAP